MLSRSRIVALVLTAALGVMALPSTIAQAGGQQVDVNGSAVRVPEGSVLATPEEVSLMGGSPQEVAAQQAAWDSLPPALARQQRRLSAQQHELYEPAFANVVDVAPWDETMASPGTIRPMVYQEYCPSGSYQSFYKIMSDWQPVQCFAGGVGTYTLTTQFYDYGSYSSIRVQAAAHKGRFYYRIWNTYYWSETRGPNDYTWYEYGELPCCGDKNIYVVKVQFVA